jgi:hypothetical protein
MITCVPELGMARPLDIEPYAQMKERIEAACNTINLLIENGMPPPADELSEQNEEEVSELIKAFAEDELKASQALSTNRISDMAPEAVFEVSRILSEFGRSVVGNSVQIRNLVTNKLLIESTNPDARVRIKALEMLGRAVGLFTEYTEVTINQRSTIDIKQSLLEKLERLKTEQIVDAELVEEAEDA